MGGAPLEGMKVWAPPPTYFSVTPFPFFAPLPFLPPPCDKGMVHYGTNFIQQLIAGYALCCNVSFGHYLLFIVSESYWFIGTEGYMQKWKELKLCLLLKHFYCRSFFDGFFSSSFFIILFYESVMKLSCLFLVCLMKLGSILVTLFGFVPSLFYNLWLLVCLHVLISFFMKYAYPNFFKE